jgi:hypothetical protein
MYRQILMPLTLGFAVIGIALASERHVAAAEKVDEPKIARVVLMPNLPQPFAISDWDRVTRDYLELLFDFDRQGDHLPLVKWRDEERKMVAIPAYIGGPRDPEAINFLAAVVSGSLVGIDMQNYGGHDWVAMGDRFFDREEGVYLNRIDSEAGRSFWYDIFPNVLAYQVNALYPNDARDETAKAVAVRWHDACVALGGSTDPPGLPCFNHTGFSLQTMQPMERGWIEPEAAAGIAWMQYIAWQRFKDPRFLTAADWCLRSLEARPADASPLYEVLLPYGALAAARMNAELGRDYDVERLLNNCFEPRGRPQARPGWGVIADRWQENDVHGLVGSATDGGGYAFAMNTYQWVGALVPLARYDTRYARDIGKWTLNVANASRLFYANAHDDEHQSSYAWAKEHDPKSAVGYEGIRKWKRGSAVARNDLRTVNGRIVDGSYAATHFLRESPPIRQVLEEEPVDGGAFEHVWEVDLPDAEKRWLVVTAKRVDGGHADNAFRFSCADKPAGPYVEAFVVDGAEGTQLAALPAEFKSTLYVKAESTDRTAGATGQDRLVVDALAVTYQMDVGPFAQGDRVVSFVALIEESTVPIVLYRPVSATTDFGLYGSSHVGILGGIIGRTNVEHILRLDLLKTDYFRDAAYPSFLYYNPHDTEETVEVDVGLQPRDVYDAVSDELLHQNVTGQVQVAIPADEARIVVLAPTGQELRREGGKTLIGDVVVRYAN